MQPKILRGGYNRLLVLLLAIAAMFLGACSGPATTAERTGTSRAAAGAAAVNTDKANYTQAESVVVSYFNSANYNDWVAIAPNPSAATTYIAYDYTNGVSDGTKTFSLAGLNDGDYVARLYDGGGYTILASATFHVGAIGAPITTNKNNYAADEAVTVTYSAMPSSGNEWVSLAEAGSSDNSYADWFYTNGAPSGTHVFASPGTGTWVARGYSSGFNKLYESAPFTVGAGANSPTVTADKGAYTTAETASFHYTNAPGSPLDWIGIAPSAAPAAYVRWKYTGGGAMGDVTIGLQDLAAGNYVARLYSEQSVVLATTGTFSITVAAGPVAGGTITPDKLAYTQSETAHIGFTSNTPTSTDWIGIGPAANPTSYMTWKYTDGTAAGNVDFALLSLPAGDYKAVLYAENSFNVLATSGTITISADAPQSLNVSPSKAQYAADETVVINFTGLEGNSNDWIAITTPGSAPGAYLDYKYTNGTVNGSASFVGLTAGTYVARAHYAGGNATAYESVSFDVLP